MHAPPTATALDHLGAIVRDLAAGAARWEQLGFLLTPVSRQRGRLPGREDESLWASANRCAVFETGYLELIGLVDTHAFNPWEKFLQRFEGGHLLALRVPNADAAWTRLSQQPVALDAPVQRQRQLDVDGVQQTMRFRNIFSRDAACPEGRYIVIEHQTPAYLWQPRYLTHPNGARALTAVMLCADDTEALAMRLATLCEAPAIKAADGTRHLQPPGGGRIELYPPQIWAQRYGTAPAVRPCFAGVEIRFASRTRAAALMAQNGVSVQAGLNEERFVLPASTNGILMRLVE